MRTIMLSMFCAALALGACSPGAYRRDYSTLAPFQAYPFFDIIEDHPFDKPLDPQVAEALHVALAEALRAKGLRAASTPADRPRSLKFVFSGDIDGSRTRILALAANGARNWVYQLRKKDDLDPFLALEVYEAQSGSLIFRSEIQAKETPAASVDALLSGFPPRLN